MLCKLMRSSNSYSAKQTVRALVFTFTVTLHGMERLSALLFPSAPFISLSCCHQAPLQGALLQSP